jgi:GH43 family beta-xylosidase
MKKFLKAAIAVSLTLTMITTGVSVTATNLTDDSSITTALNTTLAGDGSSIAADSNSTAADTGSMADSKEPWNIELFNDPILKDAEGNPYDKGNPWWNADPEIHRFDGKFWIYSTRSNVYDAQLNMDCFSSDDLITWEKHEAILDTTAFTDAWRSCWAPTVEKKDGYYYILFGTNDLNLSNGTGVNDNNERNTGDVGGMYLLRADNPAGPFTQFMGKNVPLIPDNYFGAQAIDANMFLDDDNTMYLVFGGWSQCLMAKFKDDMTGFVPLGEDDWKNPKDETDHFWDYFIHLTNYTQGSDAQPAREGELNYNASFNGTNETYVEGPIMYKLDGLYYLMYSVGGWTTDTYGLRYAVAKSPMGPFTTVPGRILQTRYSASSRGAGHNSMVYIEENDTWLCCYHRRPIGGGTNDRYVAMDVMKMYKGQITFLGDSEPTVARLFEPIRATKYWSADNPLPQNLAQFVQIGPGPVYSASGSGSSQPAGRAFDTGINTVSYWQSNNANAGHWLRVDFGTAKTYNEIQVYFNQLGSGTDSISANTSVRIQKSDDGTDWTDLVFTAGDSGSTPGRVLSAAERTRRDTSYFFVREALDTPVTSRYLRLYFPEVQTVGVHEFEVYNIESVNQLVALENAGAKIEEVTPGTIPPSVSAQLAVGESLSSSLVGETLSFSAVAPTQNIMSTAAGQTGDFQVAGQIGEIPVMGSAVPLDEDGFEDFTTVNLTAERNSISPMTVVPGSGMRGSTDPYVVYDKGYYYYVRAENETSITVSKSRRLEDIGKAKKTTVWAPDFAEFPILRSPELHYINGKWYLYVSASDGDGHGASLNLPANRWDDNYYYNIYALEADNPTGPFTMKGMVTAGDEWAVDGTVLRDFADGKNYFVWSGRNKAPQKPPGSPPTPKITGITTNATTPAGEGVGNIIDNNTTTKMYTGTAFPINIFMEYSESVAVDSFRIGTANDSNNRDPRQFTIAGSNDGADYEVFYTHDANLTTDRNTLATFNLSNPVTYKYYRLQITANRSATGCQLSEFNLLGDFNRDEFAPDVRYTQNLYIAEMQNPWTIGARSLISEPTLGWERGTLTNSNIMNINEGPAVTVRDGTVYIFYSANTGTHVNSSIGMIKAEQGSNLLEKSNWIKAQQPIFRGDTGTTVGTAGVFYVRQPCLVQSPDGTEDWLLYQAGSRSYGNASFNGNGNQNNTRYYFNSMKDRSVRMQRVGWDEDGNPAFGNPAALSASFPQPSGTENDDIYILEAEDAVLTGVQNPSDRTTPAELRKVTGITNLWLRGGNENGNRQGNAYGGWGTYWNASGGLAVRLGQNGSSKFEIDVAKAGIYDLSVIGVALEYGAKQIVDVNGTEYEIIHTLYSQRYGGLFTPQSLSVKLKEGKNVITISNEAGSIGAVIDYIYLDLTAENVSISDAADIFVDLRNVGSAAYIPDSVVFTLVPNADMKANMIVARYNSKNALVSTELRPLDLITGVSLTETVYIPSDTEYQCKVFFWDVNFCPLTKVVSSGK